MKGLLSIVTLSVGIAFTVPAFAGDVSTAKTEDECQTAGGVWNADTATCEAKQ
jgi:hypothetical protein